VALIKTPICDFDWPAPDFDLQGVDGNRYTYQDVEGPNGTLVMFICNHCPYVKAVLDEIIRDVRELSTMGVGAVAIMPNDVASYPDDSFDNMRRLSDRMRLPFPYVIDDAQEVGRAYDAVCTPDFFGFDRARGLQYRGRITELNGLRPVPGAARDLFDAMVSVVCIGHGPENQLASMGCSVKWK
jgi:peroxiredoxin